MTHPEPFDMDEEEFLAGRDGREPDVDDVFAKPFKRMLAEMLRDAPEDMEHDATEDGLPSMFAAGITIRDVPCGIVMQGPDREPVGGYLSCDVGIDPAWQRRLLGMELVIERCLRDGKNPVSNLDSACYSRAGMATFRAAWRHARENPHETAARVARLRRNKREARNGDTA